MNSNLYSGVKNIKDHAIKVHEDSNYLDNLTSLELEELENQIKYLQLFLNTLRNEFNKEFRLNNYLSMSTNIKELINNFEEPYYTYDNYDMNYNPYFDIKINIIQSFAEVIKYIEENNFKVTISISNNLSDSINIMYINVNKKFNELDELLDKKDYKQINSKSKALIESICKQILTNEKNIDTNELHKKKFPKLVSETFDILKLKVGDDTKSEIKKFISSTNKIKDGISEVRNLYSDSHANAFTQSIDSGTLPDHHFKLILDSTKCICNFILGSYDYYLKKKKEK